MKQIRIILAVIAVVFLSACTGESIESMDDLYTAGAKVEFLPETTANIQNSQSKLINYTNEHREKMGLPRLEVDYEIIQKYTDSHTEYMIKQGELSHDNFNARMQSLIGEINGLGAGENVQKQPQTMHPSVVFLWWIDSQAHRETIEGDYTHTAVTVKMGENNMYYYTQIFVKK